MILTVRDYLTYLLNFVRCITAEKRLFESAEFCTSLNDFQAIGENLKFFDCSEKFKWLMQRLYQKCDEDIEDFSAFLYSALIENTEPFIFLPASSFRTCRQIEAEYSEYMKQQKEAAE